VKRHTQSPPLGPCAHQAICEQDVTWEKDVPQGAQHPQLASSLSCVTAHSQIENRSTRQREDNRYITNLGTRFGRIIGRAGVKPWPKLFHNLRGRRETELAAECRMHVVCAWLGHSVPSAAKHYLTVTDGDFEKAAEGGA
jgi:hypothetical protein